MRSIIANLLHEVSRSIVVDKIPCAIKAKYCEKQKNYLGEPNERYHFEKNRYQAGKRLTYRKKEKAARRRCLHLLKLSTLSIFLVIEIIKYGHGSSGVKVRRDQMEDMVIDEVKNNDK